MKKHRKGDEAIFVILPYTIKMEEAENLRLGFRFNGGV
jgi:hypothetical protein